jgi:hypothetical protein
MFILSMAEYFLERNQISNRDIHVGRLACGWGTDVCVHTYSIRMLGLIRPKTGIKNLTESGKKYMGINSDIFEEGAGGAVVATGSMRIADCRTVPSTTAITSMPGLSFP